MAGFDFEKILFNTPRWIWHVAFWVIYISFFSIVYGSFEEDYLRQFQIQLTEATIQVPAVYLSLYYLMPKFLFRASYSKFFLNLVLLILAFSALAWVNFIYVQYPLFWTDDPHEPQLLNISKILKYTTKVYPVVALAIVVKWFKYWYQQQKDNQQLVQDKLQAELKFLKSQVHPHFLFNTLNNLYALTLKQSKEASEVVLKLSDLLDYMLYECNADRVLLQKEIKLVEDYIALEKIRYGNRLDVSFHLRGDVSGKVVAPLLILPFVENSFKHGVSEALDQPWVRIDLSAKETEIILKVENSKSGNEVQEDRFEYKEGIGLKNVRRRLELLYPDQYDLNIIDTEASFLVVLKLNVGKVS